MGLGRHVYRCPKGSVAGPLPRIAVRLTRKPARARVKGSLPRVRQSLLFKSVVNWGLHMF